jgi:large repetitive protein
MRQGDETAVMTGSGGISGAAAPIELRMRPARFRRWSAAFSVSALIATTVLVAGIARLAQAVPVCGSSNTPNVAATHGPYFYVNLSATPKLVSNYAGYQVRSATPVEDLWVELHDFTGGSIVLASGEQPTQSVGDLAANVTAPAFFLLTSSVSATTRTPQTHSISIYSGEPGGGGERLCTRTYTYEATVATIRAASNRVNSVTANATSVGLGETVEVTVEGVTGTLGAGPSNDPGVLAYTPAVFADFPAAAWRLIGTRLTISPDGSKPPVTFVDRLHLGRASGSSRDYEAVYTFQAVGVSLTATPVVPVQYIASGTQVKHTEPVALASPLPAVTNTLTVTKTSSVDRRVGGGAVDYTVTISNSGGQPVKVDAIADTVPTGATLSGAKINGQGKSPTLSGTTYTWKGPHTVPAGGSIVVTYRLTLPDGPATYRNSVSAKIGSSNVSSASADVFVTANPTAVADTASAGPGTAVTVDVLANDTLPALLPANGVIADPRVKTLMSVGNARFGTVEIVSGQVRYTATSAIVGTDSFTYTMSDGQGATSTATVTITPQGPEAVDDTFNGSKRAVAQNIGVLANDGCANCTITIVSGPTLTGGALPTGDGAGTASVKTAGGVPYIEYVGPGGTFPTVDDIADVTLTYQLTDPSTNLTSNVATVSILWRQAAPDHRTTLVNTPIAVAVGENDFCKAQGQFCSVSIQSTVNGTSSVTNANTTNPSVTFTPTTDFSGLASYTFLVDNASAGANRTQLTNYVLVGPANRSFTMATNGTLPDHVTTAGFRTNCATCLHWPLTAPSNGTVAISTDGSFTYRPNNGFSGTDSFTFRVSETLTGLSSTASVTINVQPDAVDDIALSPEGFPITIDVLANDACSSCTVAIASQPASGTGTVVRNSDNTVTYTPPDTTPAYTGTTTFTYTVTDGAGQTDTATVTVTVVGPPTVSASNDTFTFTLDDDNELDVLANDTCVGCTLTITDPPNTATGTATVVDGKIVYAPKTVPASSPAGYAIATLTYQVCAPAPYASTCATATVRLVPAVVAVKDNASTKVGSPVTVTVSSNDRALTGATYTIISGPNPLASASLSTDPDTGVTTLTYVPEPLVTRVDTLTYRVCQPSPDQTVCADAVVTITVGPNAIADSRTTRAETPVVIDVKANDACAACTVALLSDPSSGTANLNADGTVLYSPRPGFTGVDTFTYLLSDANGSSSATVTVTVLPTAVNDSVRTPIDATIDIDVLANDVCTSCVVTVTSQPTDSAGTASVTGSGAGQRVRFVPTADYTGTTTFTYLVRDPATGRTATATVTVLVANAVPDFYVVPAGSMSVALDVLANEGCGGCAVTGNTNPSNGSVTLAADGTGTYTATGGFVGLDSFTYTTSVGTATVRILVVPPAQALSAVSGVPLTGNLALTAANCPGCTVEVLDTAVEGDLGVTRKTGNPNQPAFEFTYAAYVPFTGADAFTYTVLTPYPELTGTSSVSFTVTAPAAPVAVDDLFRIEGGAAAGSVGTNDTGSGTLTFTLVTGPTKGTLEFNPDGTFTYTLTEGQTGDDSFTYRITDGFSQQSSTAIVALTFAPTVPGPPRNPTATRGNGSTTVTFEPPTTDGGSPILSYTVTSSPGNRTCTVTLPADPLSCTVTGLPNGTEVTFRVTATNSVGTGLPSGFSTAVTPAGPPSAPRGVQVTWRELNPNLLVVDWGVPSSDGGSPITGYFLVVQPGAKTCFTTWRSCIVDMGGPIDPEVQYTATVYASNAVGNGPNGQANSRKLENFSCAAESTFFEVVRGQLYTMTTYSGTRTPVGPQVNVNYNALAFNPFDGFLYAMRPNSGLLRIGANGPTELGLVAGLPVSTYIAGDIDPATGFFYVSTGGPSLYRIDLATLTAVEVTLPEAFIGVGLDFAIRDGWLWTVTSGFITGFELNGEGVAQYAAPELTNVGSLWWLGTGSIGYRTNVTGVFYTVTGLGSGSIVVSDGTQGEAVVHTDGAHCLAPAS